MNTQKISFLLLTTLALSACGQSTGFGPSSSSGSGGSSGGGSSGCNPCRIFGSATLRQGDFAYLSSIKVAADAVCAADANKPATGTYKALVASPSRLPPSTDWPLQANVAYVRVNGTTAIGTTTANAVFSHPLTNSMTGAAGTYYWTGIDIGTSPYSVNSDNCDSFTDSTAGGTPAGAAGHGALTGITSQGVSGGGGRDCSSSLGFYCVEQ